jgi:hypothetical protein
MFEAKIPRRSRGDPVFSGLAAPISEHDDVYLWEEVDKNQAFAARDPAPSSWRHFFSAAMNICFPRRRWARGKRR